jgi:hypothetical protein
MTNTQTPSAPATTHASPPPHAGPTISSSTDPSSLPLPPPVQLSSSLSVSGESTTADGTHVPSNKPEESSKPISTAGPIGKDTSSQAGQGSQFGQITKEKAGKAVSTSKKPTAKPQKKKGGFFSALKRVLLPCAGPSKAHDIEVDVNPASATTATTTTSGAANPNAKSEVTLGATPAVAPAFNEKNGVDQSKVTTEPESAGDKHSGIHHLQEPSDTTTAASAVTSPTTTVPPAEIVTPAIHGPVSLISESETITHPPPLSPLLAPSTTLQDKPADSHQEEDADALVIPPLAPQGVLSLAETAGVTSGAVVPPGAIAGVGAGAESTVVHGIGQGTGSETGTEMGSGSRPGSGIGTGTDHEMTETGKDTEVETEMLEYSRTTTSGRDSFYDETETDGEHGYDRDHHENGRYHDDDQQYDRDHDTHSNDSLDTEDGEYLHEQELDEEEDENRLIINGGAGIPIGPVSIGFVSLLRWFRSRKEDHC